MLQDQINSLYIDVSKLHLIYLFTYFFLIIQPILIPGCPIPMSLLRPLASHADAQCTIYDILPESFLKPFLTRQFITL